MEPVQKEKPRQRPTNVIVRVTSVEKALWKSAAMSQELDLSKLVRLAVKRWLRESANGAEQ
jgi:hypothetical protein